MHSQWSEINDTIISKSTWPKFQLFKITRQEATRKRQLKKKGKSWREKIINCITSLYNKINVKVNTREIGCVTWDGKEVSDKSVIDEIYEYLID